MSETVTLDLARRDPYADGSAYRWLALAAALLAWGFDGVEQGVYSIMTRQALKELVPNLPADVTAAEGIISKVYSLSIAMWLWGAAVGGILFGRIGDRFGRVRGLLGSVTTYALFTGLSAIAADTHQFLACRFMGAVGLGGTWPLCVALVVETWPERYRGRLAGSIGAAANVGFLLASIYSGIMLRAGYNWRWIIGMGMVIGLASLPVILFVPEPTKWRESRQKRERSKLSDLFTPQYRRATIVGSLLSMVALLGTWGSFLWLSTHVDKLAEGTRYASSAKATVSLWSSFGQIFGGFVGGLMAGWFGTKRSFAILCIGAFSSVFALFAFNSHFSLRMAAMAVVAGVFVTAFFGWLPKYLPELYPTRIRASGQGLAYNSARILTGFGVLGAGKLVDLFHGNYARGMMVMSCIYLLGLVVILFAPETAGRMHEEPVSPSEPRA